MIFCGWLWAGPSPIFKSLKETLLLLFTPAAAWASLVPPHFVYESKRAKPIKRSTGQGPSLAHFHINGKELFILFIYFRKRQKDFNFIEVN